MLKAVDILSFLGSLGASGNLEREIKGYSSIIDPKEQSLVFCKRGFESYLEGVKKCTVIIPHLGEFPNGDNTYIMSNNPRLLFAKVAAEHFTYGDLLQEIDISAHVSESVSIEGRVKIGKNVFIQPHCTIGTAGPGYERDNAGKFIWLPQLGGTIIENDVAVFTHANIHRGTLGDTIIKEGSIISVHCNVGHNCIVGKHTFLAGKTNLGGKTKVGDYCFLGMGVITKPGVVIGDNVVVGMGSIVTRDIPDKMIAYGNPAKVMKTNPVTARGT